MSAAVCRRRHCGSVLDVRTDGNGRLVAICSACERNRAGLCRDCPNRLPNAKWMRCERCSAARRRAKHGRLYDRERYARERDRRLATQKRYYGRNRERLCARLREKRRGHRPDDLDRLYSRVKAREYRARHHDKVLRKANRYYRTHREQVLARHRERRRSPAARARAREYQRELRELKRSLSTPAPGCCLVCSVEIPYQGHGRRRAYCDAHRHHKYRRYRARRAECAA